MRKIARRPGQAIIVEGDEQNSNWRSRENVALKDRQSLLAHYCRAMATL